MQGHAYPFLEKLKYLYEEESRIQVASSNINTSISWPLTEPCLIPFLTSWSWLCAAKWPSYASQWLARIICCTLPGVTYWMTRMTGWNWLHQQERVARLAFVQLESIALGWEIAIKTIQDHPWIALVKPYWQISWHVKWLKNEAAANTSGCTDIEWKPTLTKTQGGDCLTMNCFFQLRTESVLLPVLGFLVVPYHPH